MHVVVKLNIIYIGFLALNFTRNNNPLNLGVPILRINVASQDVLERLLQRKMLKAFSSKQVNLMEMFETILMWANEFVPSESGSIFLDDPIVKAHDGKRGKLYFAACYGKGSEKLTGSFLPTDIGIVGQTYTNGRPYISEDVNTDNSFYSKIDKKTSFSSKSIICAPIKIHGAIIGVIELINRHGRINYDARDLTLLEIFAGYTSTLIQNSLDAKRFRELSIRDNLTGLYNDRFFFDHLTAECERAINTTSNLSLIFMDLDNFKQINDTHGHLAGSQTLQEVGLLIMRRIGSNSGIIPVRYGGDEFSLILPDTDLNDAAEFAETIRGTIEAHVFLGKDAPGTLNTLNIKGLLTCSIGVSSLNLSIIRAKDTSRNELGESLIRDADAAMYRSKLYGKNRVTTTETATLDKPNLLP